VARIRTIKPSMFTSRTVSTYSDAEFRLFAGLICYCDDAGRGEDDPDLIKSVVAPRIARFSPRAIEKHMERLADKTRDPSGEPPICRYTVDDLRLFHFINWQHQRINRPTPSVLPPCPHHEPEGLFP